jgi:hypothetical protein
MARAVSTLPAGSPITDYMSLGVIAKFIQLERVRGVLEKACRPGMWERDLPAYVVVCYPHFRFEYLAIPS